ncbi:MAG TPA: tyrosine--tRNA ligase [Candidatus Moranbacteria bacterium]|nr:tyrosine--tRNA ligase [Candidatus Moranbacteria bacterium]
MSKIITDEKQIDEILERGVIVEILPTKKEFKQKLMSGERLRFYIGADPTAKSLHLGHAQNLIILESFRRLGHEVIFLIGDFTGMIGDPSEKSSTRVKQTRQEVEENFKNWKDQVKNILNFNDKENPVKIEYNSKWLSKLNFSEVLELASNFTVQQMLERDMFEKRLQEGKPIYLHEFLYPLMQGYDSVVMNVDVEMCGTDQTFNALAGRTLMQKIKNKDKFVVVNGLIADEKTGLLMSKSNGTGVFLNLSAKDLFGAIMAQSDGMMRPLMLGCTRFPLKEIERLMQLENPKDAKMALAFEITKNFHGEKLAVQAREDFENKFSKKETPIDAPEMIVAEGDNLINKIIKEALAESKGNAKRKIKQGGVSLNGEKILAVDYKFTKIDDGKILKVGKKDFRKVKIEK